MSVIRDKRAVRVEDSLSLVLLFDVLLSFCWSGYSGFPFCLSIEFLDSQAIILSQTKVEKETSLIKTLPRKKKNKLP